MARAAIFVDAGYLYAAGSAAIVGSNRPRNKLELNRVAAIDKLRATASFKTNNASLLRIYWYDGVSYSGPSGEQQSLADMDDVKLRLGVINTYGQQKGVDSLIVTDMVELARNHAITDAVLLSGDEDVRIGVQIAQSFGVRVHLLGIEPSRGNQARSLRQESDTTNEWSKSDIGEILALKRPFVSGATTAHPIDAGVSDIFIDALVELDKVVDECIDSMSQSDLSDVAALASNAMLPRDFDSKLLAVSRERIGRDLDLDERRYIRNKFKARAGAAISQLG